MHGSGVGNRTYRIALSMNGNVINTVAALRAAGGLVNRANSRNVLLDDGESVWYSPVGDSAVAF